MTDADLLNATLASAWPAAARCLSGRGLSASFPRGIPFQSAEAKGASLNATIGQVTDGAGHPLPLPSLQAAAGGLDPEMSFLYSPMAGHGALRTAWRARQVGLAGLAPEHAPMSQPVVTHGLTQGVALVAALFAGVGTRVLVPTPGWENYELVFSWHGADLVPYACLRDGRFNVDGLADALAQTTGPCVVVLNLPGNPTGYAPPAEDVARIAEVIHAHPGPAVAVVDDAYQGMLWEDGLLPRSLYWELAQGADPDRLLPVKVDGATKELLFFPGRVGFLATPLTGAAEDALLSKLLCVGRATVGSPPGPSQAMALATLRSPTLADEIDAAHAVLRGRYRALRDALAEVDPAVLSPWPFNAGCFALVDLPDGVDPEQTRRRLLAEESVGTVSMPGTQALRIAYCSVAERDLPELVHRMARLIASSPG